MFDDKCQELELLTSKLAEQRAKTHHFKAETKSKLIKQEREEKINRGKRKQSVVIQRMPFQNTNALYVNG